MKPTERDELLIQLKTALLGIPETDERGMAGDIKDMANQLKDLNGSVKKNTNFRKIGSAIAAILFIALIPIILNALGVI